MKQGSMEGRGKEVQKARNSHRSREKKPRKLILLNNTEGNIGREKGKQ